MAKAPSSRPARLTRSQERFCLELIQPGVSQAEAYRRTFPKARKWTDKTVRNRAYELAKSRDVLGRVSELRKKLEAEMTVTAQDVIRELGKVAKANVPVKGSDKVSALDKLMKHFGQYERDNRQITDPFAAMLERINGSVLKPGHTNAQPQ